ncbi:unnamed protein product [Linum trigynum]|uniref:Uncharacterized protein n=1 Tax=Linum trigynum TaxID=586398 RepID=A0AAV2DLX6_9ROSI
MVTVSFGNLAVTVSFGFRSPALHVSLRFRRRGGESSESASALDYLIVEGVGLAWVENQGEGVVGVEGVVDLEDVWVRREEEHDLGLLLEAVAVGLVGEHGFVDGLAGEEGFLRRREAPGDHWRLGSWFLSIGFLVLVVNGRIWGRRWMRGSWFLT